MFGNKDEGVRGELERLKKRLFGTGNTVCLNVSTYDKTNSILGGHRYRIDELENQVHELQNSVAELRVVKVRKGK